MIDSCCYAKAQFQISISTEAIFLLSEPTFTANCSHQSMIWAKKCKLYLIKSPYTRVNNINDGRRSAL